VRQYRPPLIFAAEVLGSFVLGRQRDMARDSRRLLASLPFQPRVEGQEQIPPEGPCVIVANHYERPGLWVGWGAFLITVTVAERRPARPAVRWVHISEWTRYNFHGLELPTAFTRGLIQRASRTWGLLPIPPPGRTNP
jgi:hypothetical protein